MFAENNPQLLDLFRSQTEVLVAPATDGITEYVLTARYDEDAVLRGGPIYYLWTRDAGTEYSELVFTGFTYDRKDTAEQAVSCFTYVERITDQIEDMRHLNYESGDPYGDDTW